jgi:hypothetical protein
MAFLRWISSSEQVVRREEVVELTPKSKWGAEFESDAQKEGLGQ